ncbi:hypothetical protein ACFFJX_28520 [Pseudarcicella hirudinis]|uniref:hypothetical protein n=1 Tax=Pseudarcicella hirudinis TaxID=1079859 RepID=UPI0035EFC470
MRKVKNIYKLALLSVIAIFATSCYKENNIIDGILDSKGKVAQIAVFWPGTTRLTATGSLITSVTVDTLSSVNCTIEYTTEVDVKEFRLYSAPTAAGTKTLISTVPLKDSKVKFDNDLRNYVVTIPVQAPRTKKKQA